MSSIIPLTLIAAAMLAATYFLLRPFIAAGRVGWTALAIVAAAPATVVALYAAVGEPSALLRAEDGTRGTPQPQRMSQSVATEPAARTQAGSISTLVEGLAARLAAGSGDAGDWLLLAQSYEHLGKPRKAWEAYQEALRRGARDEALAQRLTFARFGEQADGALDGFRVSGTLDADAAARAAIPEGATLFVIARAADGPPMPLAVARYTVETFPVSFELDAGDLIQPATEASRYARFTIYAKVSPNGDANTSVPGIASSRVETGAAEAPVALQLHARTGG